MPTMNAEQQIDTIRKHATAIIGHYAYGPADEREAHADALAVLGTLIAVNPFQWALGDLTVQTPAERVAPLVALAREGRCLIELGIILDTLNLDHLLDA